MKKFKFIFTFIFLSGILFSVFQYLPTLEEETPENYTELAKNSCEDDNSEKNNNETDSDTDDVLNNHFNFCFVNFHSKNTPLSSNKEDYNSYFQKINTPPPEA